MKATMPASKGRRMAMYLSVHTSFKGGPPLRLLGSNIDGITHTETSITVPAGTYLFTVERVAIEKSYRLFANIGDPPALELIEGSDIVAAALNYVYAHSSTTIASYTVATQIRFGEKARKSRNFRLTIEQLD